MKNRCFWVSESQLYIDYHDTEWGVPVFDDAILFEMLVLESFQSGLSWITILNKRENFRIAFDNFEYRKIAIYKENKCDLLMKNKGIVRNKLKIKGAIVNAQLFLEVQKEFGSFSNYIWAYVQGKQLCNHWCTNASVPAHTLLSSTISKDLKKRGFKFLGATVIYAYMQAIGMVNDHTKDCFKYFER
jgi:DNA-3-methyladenine glycosylase I